MIDLWLRVRWLVVTVIGCVYVFFAPLMWRKGRK